MNREAGVQRNDAIPLYHQIYLALRDDIYRGSLAHGALMWTELEVGERFGVSRITARRALKELADNNLVERRRRVGTRVIFKPAKPPIEVSADEAVESLLSFVRATEVKVIDYQRAEASPDIAEALRLQPGDSVIRATRVRSLHGEPLGLVESHVPTAVGGQLSRAKLGKKPLLELLQSAGYHVAEGRQVISAVAAGPTLAMQLGVEARAPLIRIERTIYSDSGEALAHTIAQYRGDRYRLALDMHAVPHPIAD
jgi:GntR family transcriptional regulator